MDESDKAPGLTPQQKAAAREAASLFGRMGGLASAASMSKAKLKARAKKASRAAARSKEACEHPEDRRTRTATGARACGRCGRKLEE